MVSPTVQQLAQQNDEFRQGKPGIPGQRFITMGINELLKQLEIPPEQLAQAVAEFSQFTEENNPHGEHDFGAFEFHKHKCFWKIDYYDLDYTMGFDDPSDLSKTRRVLTIMLAEEW
ncbi:DUF3768 domain-containing protein [Ascidiaceihabitans sp.]|uniref:DUF3768 domain-containing protein n=1 Tax=Ascidiaceihabitans sp. TaxID=1872644 RepID=UPI0032983366